MERTLENEKATDVTLTEVAESFINEQAAAGYTMIGASGESQRFFKQLYGA